MADYFKHESAYIDKGAFVGKETMIWHFCHIMSGARIGRNCTLGQNVFVHSNVTIGSYCKIQNNISVYEWVVLEDYVFCGPSMVFTNIRGPRCKYPHRGTAFYVSTRVREGATIGANATIVCENSIGKHAFIAAGAVVTRDVADFALMAGVTARRISWACECGVILPEVSKNVICPRCGLAYTLKEPKVLIGQV